MEDVTKYQKLINICNQALLRELRVKTDFFALLITFLYIYPKKPIFFLYLSLLNHHPTVIYKFNICIQNKITIL